MRSDTGTLVRASAGLWVSRGATIALQALHFALVARMLSPGSFGGYVAALATLGIAGAVSEFGLVNVVVLALERHRHDPEVVLRTATRATAVLAGVALVLLLPAAHLLLPGDGRSAVLLLLPWFLVTRAALPYLSLRQHQLRFGRVAVADIVGRTIPVIAAVPVLLAGDGWQSRTLIAAVAAGLFAGGLAQVVILHQRSRGPAGPRRWSEVFALLREALPLGATNAVSFAHTRVDQLVLSGFGYRGALAAYAVAYRALDAALALVMTLGGVAFPLLSRADAAQRSALARRQAALTAAAALAMGLAAFALAPQLVVLVGGRDYADAAWLLRLLAPALVISTLNMGSAQIAIVEGRAGTLLRIAGLGLACNLALNLALDGAHGAKAAALSTVASELLGFVLVMGVARRALPDAIDVRTLLVPLLAFPVASFGALAAWRSAGVAAGLLVAGVAVAAAAGQLRAPLGAVVTDARVPAAR